MADETPTILGAARAALDAALEAGRRSLDGGRAIDEHQVHAERLAYAATEVAAAEALAAYARDRHAAGAGDATTDAMAAAFAAEVADCLAARIAGHREDFGVGTTPLENAAVQAAIRTAQHEARFREIGREVIRTRGANNAWLESDMAVMARDSARTFARKAVAPIADDEFDRLFIVTINGEQSRVVKLRYPGCPGS